MTDKTRLTAATKLDELPRFMSIHNLAQTGFLPEHTLRLLVKQNKIPYIKTGVKVLINVTEAARTVNEMSQAAGDGDVRRVC